jgi:hypothetical protein
MTKIKELQEQLQLAQKQANQNAFVQSDDQHCEIETLRKKVSIKELYQVVVFFSGLKIEIVLIELYCTIQQLFQYTEQVDIIIQSEREKVQRDLKEANHLIKAKDELIIQLKSKVSQLESQCQAKDRLSNSLALKLKNQEDLIALFEKNYNSLRAQISDLQVKFEKENLYG